MVLEDNIALLSGGLSFTVHYVSSQETYFSSKNKICDVLIKMYKQYALR